MDASVRHLGTDKNYIVLNNIYNFLKDKVDFYFDTPVSNIEILGDDKGYIINTEKKVTSVKMYCFSWSKWK